MKILQIYIARARQRWAWLPWKDMLQLCIFFYRKNYLDINPSILSCMIHSDDLLLLVPIQHLWIVVCKNLNMSINFSSNIEPILTRFEHQNL